MHKRIYLLVFFAVGLGASIGSPRPAAAGCADACQLGAAFDNASCQLWDTRNRVWIDDIDDGEGQLHNRARVYLPWLRELMLPAGGVMSPVFTDATYRTVGLYTGRRDAAIWTGAYLAAEALRYLATQAPDAQAQMASTLQVLHRWWNIPGDPGNLARFAAPADSPPEILATLPASDDEVHQTVYEGEDWTWRGAVSRDQYQGVMLGYSLAYDALTDPTLRAVIRADVVEFAEQLMRRERREVALIINGQRTEVKLELENVIYSASDMPDGIPTVEVDLGSQEVEGQGLLVFWPNPALYLRQIPGLGWLPDVKLRSQAIQLAAIFRVALQVTEGVPGYEQRYQALSTYYDQHYNEWLDMADGWENTNDCGDSYHGLNIAFMPAFNWARLESDPERRELVRRGVLHDRLWPAVADHKNPFFAYIYASQAPAGIDVSGIVAPHTAQLSGFPSAPNEAVAVDLRGIYPEDSACPGQSSIAIDVSQRVPATFLWQHQPWKLHDPGVPHRLFGGVDYLLAYWMGRYFGFIADDSPETCLAYRIADPDLWIPLAEAEVNHEWSFVDAASGFADPVAIAGPPTYQGGDPGVVRLRGVNALGFELRFQEWDYRDGSHVFEDIPYVVLQAGRYLMRDGSVWEVGTFDLGETGSWQGVSFTEAFANPPHLFLTMQTSDGEQAASLRARNVTTSGFQAALFEQESLMDGHAIEKIGYLAIRSAAGGGVIDLDEQQVPYLLQTVTADHRWLPVLSQRLKLEEEQSRDSETGHVDENLHVLALGNQIFAQQVTHNGGDTTALRRLPPTAQAPMEWGLIRGIDHNWQTLPFAKSYTDAVVIAKPASHKGGDPGVIRLRNVAGDMAELRYQEWNYLDGGHLREDVFYLVSEAGQHSLGGLAVEADWLQTNRLGRGGQWESVSFNHLFMIDPVVLTSVMTYNGGDTVTTRVRGLDLDGFQLAMDEQESKADGHVGETLGWIAIKPGTVTTSDGRALDVFFTSLDHQLTAIPYAGATPHRYPSVIADIDSTYGADPVFLRYANPTNSQITLKLAEEQSQDAETDHVLEDVGVFTGE
jgi:hypothetical protein